MTEKRLIGSNKLTLNILGSSIYKGVTVIANLLLVRVCVDYMGEEKYGIWLTLLSFFTWFSVLEVGISNSYRNKLTAYFTSRDFTSGKETVTKTYKAIGLVYLGISLLIIGCSLFFPFEQFFLPSNYVGQDFGVAFRLSTLLYMLFYIAFVLNTILLSAHYARTTYLVMALQSLTILVGVYCFKYLNIEATFTLIFAWFSGVPLFFWLAANIVAYRTVLSTVSPDIGVLIRKKTAPFKNINWGFFIIQLCTLIIYTTDNFIIINKLTGTEVLKYNVAFKYFNILIVIFNLIIVPYWSSFTEAALLKNKHWIQTQIKKLVRVWLALVLMAGLLFFFSTNAYEFWIGKNLRISPALSLFMGISMLFTAWNSIFAYFLNAISEIKLQMRILVFSSAINVPLSLLMINKFGTKGVIIATCLSLLPLFIALPFQYHTIVKKMK